MPTRRADESSSEHAAQERFMSSTEYVARRGVLANAVAVKAQLYRSAAHRSLLFFLQGLSMDNGGLRAVASELFDMFHDRISSKCESGAGNPDAEFCLFMLEHDPSVSDEQRHATR